MKWSEITLDDFYIPFDENQRAIRGFWLTTLDIDLENLPNIFDQSFKYFEERKNCYRSVEKVYLTSIVGTSYKEYSDTKIIKSYAKIKRACRYITCGCVTRNKYFYRLKQSIDKQNPPIILSKNQDGTYYIDGNGNHRIILYKMMMLAEIAIKYPNAYIYEPDFINRLTFGDVTDKYWLNAVIKSIRGDS